jgi:hypothetical protein
MTLPLALTVADGGLILVGLLVLGVVVIAFSLYTRRGSGISGHPYADLDHSSGPESSSDWDDATEEIRNLGRGTAGRHGHRHPPPPPN